MDNQPTLAVRSLAVRYGNRNVLADVSFDVADGEWVNVVGPNGAGKTTMLRAVLGTVPFSGDVAVGGATRKQALSWATQVAYVPQTPTIPAGMSVVDYIMLGRTAHRGVFGRERKVDWVVVADVVEKLSLGAMVTRTVDSLSGGERQRVVLARALAQQATMLLLDEPTTALDLGHQQQVLDVVQELRVTEGLTILATLHDLTLAARYGDRVVLLAEGTVHATGPAESVLTVDNIAHHFGAEVRIIDDEAGPIIVPAPTSGR